MKNLLFLFIATLSVNCGYAQADTVNGPKITFEKTKWVFPKIAQGSGFRKEFVFTNTGKSPLIITNAQTSCGCDMAEFPKAPVAPGKTGIITYIYDSQRAGVFSKTFTVTSNAVNTPFLSISVNGEVAPEETSPAPNRHHGVAPDAGKATLPPAERPSLYDNNPVPAGKSTSVKRDARE